MQQWLEDKPEPRPAGFCDGCGAPVTDADRFCTACGRPLREFCSWCGTELPADGRVCVSCGRPAVRDRARI
ncbi:MAG: zinc ribbon domain-containing protein, partial [Dehalococcoidia bacterium]